MTDEAEADKPSVEERVRAALPKATRWLMGTRLGSPAEELRELADEAERLPDAEQWDRYGARGAVAELESQVAELLGKPAAAVFPSGVMAQQSVLRVWCERQGSARVALPQLSHLLHHEADGPRLLNPIRYEFLTVGAEVPTAEHLAAIPGRLGAVLLELPLRDAGYLLPTWDELVAVAAGARERAVPVHFDGARIWESQPYLQHSLSEIADLADSVYVSLYKGLAGLAGAVVAGPDDVVAEARLWRTRHGGTLFSLAPYALGGLRGLRRQLPLMPALYERACVLAPELARQGYRVVPDPPHTNAFRIYADRRADAVNERVVTAIEGGTALVWPFRPGDMPETCWAEFTVGPATLEWSVDEAAEALGGLLG